MEFNSNKSIYLQIAESICEKILSGEKAEEDRIPSVRECGAELGVNPNTVMRSYEKLTAEGIIYNKRGLGYFVSSGAKRQIKKTRKQEFMKERLPELARQMVLLDISLDEVKEALQSKLDEIDVMPQ